MLLEHLNMGQKRQEMIRHAAATAAEDIWFLREYVLARARSLSQDHPHDLD